ncbi:hypothetical protein BJ742DRAFT_822419 [Cladochytrium replicatum]|nr:hypothetical protein BJ742DRAFT_822419 [Cladochytrium replicatum]
MVHNDVAQEFCNAFYGAHQVLRRAIISILDHAPKLTTVADVNDFVTYVDTFRDFLVSHHHHEDDVAFPYLSRGKSVPGLSKIDVPGAPRLEFSRFHREHGELHNLLENLKEWTTSARKSLDADLAKSPKPATPSAYDHASLTKTITSIQIFLLPHLKAEEDLCTPESIRERFSNREIKIISNEVERAAMASGDPRYVMPLILFNLDDDDRRAWFTERMPWWFRRVILPYVFLPWTKHIFRFGATWTPVTPTV